MIKSVSFRSYSFLTECRDTKGKFKSVATSYFPARFLSVVQCSSTRDVPKLELFSRGKFERILQDPPLIEKAETQLSDYCSTLDGDASYNCWRAYFELKDLEKEKPKGEVENLILQTDGVKSLIECLHGVASMEKNSKIKKNGLEVTDYQSERVKGMKLHVHIPDGLPKSQEELEEEEKSKMPDSAFTRLLRTKGTTPAWFSHAPDHETD